MPGWTYKTVAAPRRAKRVRGVGGPEARLAHAMGEMISAEAVEGWEYLRTDSIPVEEGGGMFSKAVTVWRAVLVFRRPVEAPRGREAEADLEPKGRRPGPARHDPGREAPPDISVALTPELAREMARDRGRDRDPEPPSLGGATRG